MSQRLLWNNEGQCAENGRSATEIGDGRRYLQGHIVVFDAISRKRADKRHVAVLANMARWHKQQAREAITV